MHENRTIKSAYQPVNVERVKSFEHHSFSLAGWYIISPFILSSLRKYYAPLCLALPVTAKAKPLY